LLGRDDPKTLGSLGLLALVLIYQGQWKEAEELEVQVMETSLRVLGHFITLMTVEINGAGKKDVLAVRYLVTLAEAIFTAWLGFAVYVLGT
jgi:hypothetical protein